MERKFIIKLQHKNINRWNSQYLNFRETRKTIVRRKKVEGKNITKQWISGRNVFTIPRTAKKRRWRVQVSHYNAKPPFRVESTRGKGSDTPASWLKVSKGGCSFLQSLQIAKDICQIHPADGANKQRWREKRRRREDFLPLHLKSDSIL